MIKAQKGFTLIELMLTIAIIAILGAIAIPSYQRYVIKNAEDEAKAQMGQLEIQLASWRASTLSYRGFTPINGVNQENGSATHGYNRTARGATNVLFVPLGSDENTHRYMVEIFDGESGGSLVPAANQANVDVTVGRSWGMIAYPNPRLVNGGAKKLAMSSNGQRCQSVTQTAIRVNDMKLSNAAATCAKDGVEKW